ncbi:hypothetical protein TEA_011821 [Camellia sinensis var. sinensis]|uniref:Homeobox domain-containing protein n=1 Tax=Camellia sinensis var. sinensis TaxID=542762 RepID=A0A4V3WLN2_CAMSN|nr:hypothetical protein TEA_011821 [Camellia sinensis var. sinensis]
MSNRFMNPTMTIGSSSNRAPKIGSSSGVNLEQLYPEEVNENTGEQEADLRRMSEEEVESKFGGSDNNQEGGYDEDQGESNHLRKKRRYQRHTQFQIQEMENFFKEYPHPDDKQRKVLSRELGLEPLQIKFWFQNKRTQIKKSLELTQSSKRQLVRNQQTRDRKKHTKKTNRQHKKNTKSRFAAEAQTQHFTPKLQKQNRRTKLAQSKNIAFTKNTAFTQQPSPQTEHSVIQNKNAELHPKLTQS